MERWIEAYDEALLRGFDYDAAQMVADEALRLDMSSAAIRQADIMGVSPLTTLSSILSEFYVGPVAG